MLFQINDLRTSAGRERDKLDKIIFAVTAGTLSLSITFIASSSHVFAGLYLLFASWIVLVLGLVAILLAYTFAILHFKWCEKGILQNKFLNPYEMEKNIWFILCEILNWTSLFATVVGIGLFACFGYLNIQ